MSIFWFLWVIVLTAIEIVLKYYLLEKRLGCNKKRIKSVAGGLLFFIMLSFLKSIAPNPMIFTVFEFIISIGYAYFLFGSGRIARILWGCVTALIPASANTLSVFIAKTLNYGDLSGIWNPGSVWFYTTATSVMIQMIVVLIAANMKNHDTYSLTNLQLLFLVGMSAVSVIAMGLQMEVVYTLSNILGTQKAQQNAVFVSLCFLIVLTALIFLVYGLGIQSQKTMDRSLEARQALLEKEYYESNEININALRELRHDISTHMHVMKSLMDEGRTEELRDYFNSVEDQYKKNSSLFLTENTMLNALLTSKQLAALKSHVNLKVSYSTKSAIPLSTVDFCSLIGNMMDNAIEACQKVTDDKARYVDITVGDKGDMIYIKAVNSSDGKYNFVNGELKTTKRGSKHGIGLKRIKTIAENAGGFFDINPRPDAFTAVVMLPSGRRDEKND